MKLARCRPAHRNLGTTGDYAVYISDGKVAYDGGQTHTIGAPDDVGYVACSGPAGRGKPTSELACSFNPVSFQSTYDAFGKGVQVESEAGDGFVQIDETGSLKTGRFRWDLCRSPGTKTLSRIATESASVLKQHGHKNGHNGQFLRDFRSLSVALSC